VCGCGRMGVESAGRVGGIGWWMGGGCVGVEGCVYERKYCIYMRQSASKVMSGEPLCEEGGVGEAAIRFDLAVTCGNPQDARLAANRCF
jgi:hypothetical protein